VTALPLRAARSTPLNPRDHLDQLSQANGAGSSEAHKTCRTRLVKELRLAGGARLAEGTPSSPHSSPPITMAALCPAAPRMPSTLHRPLANGRRSGESPLPGKERTRAGATFSVRQGDFSLWIRATKLRPRSARITVVDRPDGRYQSWRYKGGRLA